MNDGILKGVRKYRVCFNNHRYYCESNCDCNRDLQDTKEFVRQQKSNHLFADILVADLFL